jgi:hypothetical protein
MWGARSDERSGLHSSVVAGYRQRSLSRYMTRGTQPLLVKVKVTLRLTVSQSVCLGVEPNYGTFDHRFFFESYSLGNHYYLPVFYIYRERGRREREELLGW